MKPEEEKEPPEPCCPVSTCQSEDVVYQSDGWYECQDCGQLFKIPSVGKVKIKKLDEEGDD